MNAKDWTAASPASRPLRHRPLAEVQACLAEALAAHHGPCGAHCIHELWMRPEALVDIGALLDQLWQHAADSIPDWLPMTWFDFLPLLYEVTARFQPDGRGRANLYLVLLDYPERREQHYGVYVGMTHRPPAQRFDQHKAGIRAAGSVLKRGLELLSGPTLHLQRMPHAQAEDFEMQLAEVLRAEGLLVQGGH